MKQTADAQFDEETSNFKFASLFDRNRLSRGHQKFGVYACPYSAILNEILFKKNLVGEVLFKHESRNCNREAHSLDKGVCSFSPGRYIWFVIRPLEFLHVPMNIFVHE